MTLLHSLEDRRFDDFRKYFTAFLYRRDTEPRTITFLVHTWPYFELTMTTELKEVTDQGEDIFLISDIEYKHYDFVCKTYKSKYDIAVYNYTTNTFLFDAQLYNGLRKESFIYILADIFEYYPYGVWEFDDSL